MLNITRRVCFKLPSPFALVDKALDRTAPAHLRGLYKTELQHQQKAEQDAVDAAAVAEAKKKQPLKNKVAMTSSAAERGFVRGPGFGKNKPGGVTDTLVSDKARSETKYQVQWSEEQAAAAASAAAAGAAAFGAGTTSATTASSSAYSADPEGETGEAQALGDKIGSNLMSSFRHRHQMRTQAAAAAAQAEMEEESDVLHALSSKKDGGGGGSAAVQLDKDGNPIKKKQPPGLFKRFLSTFSLGRDDAAATRAESGDGEAPYEEMSEDKLKTGKYFQKLHAASLSSWTKQCFQRLDCVSELKLLSVEVETNADTNIVSVFVCAVDLDDKKLIEVKKWVEAICPVTKARLKLLQQMEEDDRKHSAHVLSSSGSSPPSSPSPYSSSLGARKSTRFAATDPLREFAKRKSIRWIRVDPDK